jgi:hypothetical protein
MFTVDDATAASIRDVLDRGGELSAVVELRRHFPLITDNEQARVCVRTDRRPEAAAAEVASSPPDTP